MLCSIKDREDLESLEELVFIENQVKAGRLQDKLGKQDYHHKTEKLFEPVTDTNKNTSEILPTAITETYINNNKTLEILNTEVLELMTDKGLIASYLASSLVNLFEHENKSQLR